MKKPFRKNRNINNKGLKYNYYKKYKDIKEIIEKRYNILIGVIAILIFTMFISLFKVQIVKYEVYQEKVKQANMKTYEGKSAPRGRIYDRNHILIVDNKPVKVIYYQKQENITRKEEIEISYILADHLKVPYTKLTDRMLREFWLKNHIKEGNQKITKEEYRKVEERKLNASDIEKLKIKRVTQKELNQFSNRDKEAAYIYYLMNKGYSYSEKIIKNEDVSDEEYAFIASKVSELKGVNIRLDWERSYPYKTVFKTILGSVSTNETGIPSELKEEYLKKKYSLDDRVGTSYLEYQYESYLKGEKNVYQALPSGEDVLVKEGKRGNDLVLTIDIKLQEAIEKILERELRKAKRESNTKYYNRSFVVVTDPNTGDILAMAGKQIKKEGKKYKIYDYTPGVATSPVTVGSVVKGASHTVGYNTKALKIGEKRYDTCVKLAGAPQKCSWKYLGYLDDISALKESSNTYQFYTAMKVAGYHYVYNGSFDLKKDPFKVYRDTFNEYGLGVKTGIDLPVESTGVHGKNDSSGLLLDFSIGQYDTYTPLQLAQYIGAIAKNGSRMQLHLLKGVFNSTEEKFKDPIYEYKTKQLNKVKVEQKYLDRIQLGFRQVLSAGTGYGYINLKNKPAGKTGTSQSFVDSDGDGKIDKETLTHTFVAYAPYDQPKVAFAIVSPDVYYSQTGSAYTTSVNKRITKAVSDKYFALYGKK